MGLRLHLSLDQVGWLNAAPEFVRALRRPYLHHYGQWPNAILETQAIRNIKQVDAERLRFRREFAAMFQTAIADGIAEGTIRPVDALVASQATMAFLNAAFDMRKWAWSMPRRSRPRPRPGAATDGQPPRRPARMVCAQT